MTDNDQPMSPRMRAALGMISALSAEGLVVVPMSPSPRMLRAASATAGVDETTATRVWRAMIEASE